MASEYFRIIKAKCVVWLKQEYENKVHLNDNFLRRLIAFCFAFDCSAHCHWLLTIKQKIPDESFLIPLIITKFFLNLKVENGQISSGTDKEGI